VFSELFYPHGGGAELATWLYSKLLAEEGIKVTIVTKQFPEEPAIESINSNLTIYRLPINFMFGSRYHTLANIGMLANSFINKLISQCDIVYVPCLWYSVIPFARWHNKPVVVHLHNYSIVCSTSLMFDFAEFKIKPSSLKSYVIHETIERNRSPTSVATSSLMNEFAGQFYNRMGLLGDILIFVSNAQRSLVISNVPSLKEKSCMIYNPIPNIPIVTAENSGIGYFGGRNFIKGYNIFLKTLRAIQCYSKEVKTYLTMTANEQVSVQLDNGVTMNFLPRLPEVQLISLMKQLSIVVVPSLWPEPAPYSLVQSMLLGKLVIASDIGGMPEILSGASSGIKLTQPGDHKEIAEGLCSFLSLPIEEANELGFKNREHILRKFNNKTAVCSFISVLNKLQN